MRIAPNAVSTTPSVTDALKEYQILLELPTREVLLNHLDSESMLEKRRTVRRRNQIECSRLRNMRPI